MRTLSTVAILLNLLTFLLTRFVYRRECFGTHNPNNFDWNNVTLPNDDRSWRWMV